MKDNRGFASSNTNWKHTAKSSRILLKHMANSSMQSNINDLPDELLEEIFCRLECPSAVRCKSVSKRWYALVSNPSFIRNLISHHHRLSQMQKEHNSQVLFSPAESLLNPKAPTLEAEAITRRFLLGFLEDYYVLGESNGWLCCNKRRNTSNIYICNPVTNFWLKLPPAPSSRARNLGFGFLCDPYYHIDGQTHVVTLNAECRFVVVRFVGLEFHLDRQIVEVFSSSTGRWSNLSLPAFFIKSRRAVAFDGKLHFLGPARILRFDPFKNSETCITSQCNFINLPEDCISPRELLITPSGSLGIIQILEEADIWELKEETWCLLEKKNVEEIAQNFKEAYAILPRIDIFTLLSSIATVHSKFVICYKDYKIACYKLHDGTLTTGRIGKPHKSYIWISVFPTVLPWWQGPPLNYPRIPSS
ncbi:hypothetical protein L6164_017568 [Bauhinia variegata]|uniref:Uncharacterized protein n=1 Tax=Bauhinia variegata TaxID=167791 RepID=A0ACB9N8J0_BAUVA|nr:hypothetical protein L6164_017568 [Bauhinia variegata]